MIPTYNTARPRPALCTARDNRLRTDSRAEVEIQSALGGRLPLIIAGSLAPHGVFALLLWREGSHLQTSVIVRFRGCSGRWVASVAW